MNGVLLALSVLGGLCWALCALGNAAVLRAQLRRQADEPTPSFVPVVGAAAGLIAWNASYDALAAHFGWPGWVEAAGVVAIVMLDVGSGPYLLLAALAVIGSLFAPAEPEPVSPEAQARIDAAVGCLLGTAVADALGLPMEGLSRQRLARWYPRLDRHRLVLGRGLCSDDSEHNVMVALSVLARGDDVGAFTGEMRGRLRWWLLALPAGVGFATLRAILKLWLFLPRRWQGVYSAGNGAAMRAPLLGVLFAHNEALLREFVHASTVLSHTDPKAECSALAVARAAREAARQNNDAAAFCDLLQHELVAFAAAGIELHALVVRAATSAARGETTLQFAEQLGLGRGVSGYAYHTVPVALHAWFAHPRDYAQAVTGVIACGGDTDTGAAIVGGIVGASVGRAGIPLLWLDRLAEWPASVAWLQALATQAQRRLLWLPYKPVREPSLLVLLPRNLVFLAIVLLHGFRRLLPPY